MCTVRPTGCTVLLESPGWAQPHHCHRPSPLRRSLQDLYEATKKAAAAGMGEHDLQPLDWGSSHFKERLMRGPLGPETLKGLYDLPVRRAPALGCVACRGGEGWSRALGHQRR